MTGGAARGRSTPGDLRLQWSNAQALRHRDPAVLARLRERVADALAALERAVAAAATPEERAALAAERAEVDEIARGLARLDAHARRDERDARDEA